MAGSCSRQLNWAAEWTPLLSLCWWRRSDLSRLKSACKTHQKNQKPKRRAQKRSGTIFLYWSCWEVYPTQVSPKVQMKDTGGCTLTGGVVKRTYLADPGLRLRLSAAKWTARWRRVRCHAVPAALTRAGVRPGSPAPQRAARTHLSPPGPGCCGGCRRTCSGW